MPWTNLLLYSNWHPNSNLYWGLLFALLQVLKSEIWNLKWFISQERVVQSILCTPLRTTKEKQNQKQIGNSSESLCYMCVQKVLQLSMEVAYKRQFTKKEYLKTLVRDWQPNKVRLWDLVQAALVKPKYLLDEIQSNLRISLYTWQGFRNNLLCCSVGMWNSWQISS